MKPMGTDTAWVPQGALDVVHTVLAPGSLIGGETDAREEPSPIQRPKVELTHQEGFVVREEGQVPGVPDIELLPILLINVEADDIAVARGGGDLLPEGIVVDAAAQAELVGSRRVNGVPERLRMKGRRGFYGTSTR